MLTVCFLPFRINAEILVQDDFETERPSFYSEWLQNTNCCTDTTISFNSNGAHSGSRGAEIHYIIDDDPRGDCQLHQDNNTCMVYNIDSPVSHYFFRGYFKIEASKGAFCNNPTIQRKLIYFKPKNYDSGGWAFFIVAWPWPNDCNVDGYNISVAYGNHGAMAATLWGDSSPGFNPVANHIYREQWYYLEVEIKYGDYSRDFMRIWLAPDGQERVLIFEKTNLTLRSATDAATNIGIGRVEVGRQVDVNRSGYSLGHINEYRYWDDIVISTTPIGPINAPSNTIESPISLQIIKE